MSPSHRTHNNVFRAIQGVIKRESEKAILITLHAPENSHHQKDFWFPISQLNSIHRCYNEEAGTFDVLMTSEWILTQKGLITATVVGNPALESKPVATPTDLNTPSVDNDIPF